MDKIHLRTRFIILFVGLIAVSLVLYLVWSNYTKQRQAEKEMREKAYVLSQQLDSVWEFMSINQNLINYDKNGEYNFKGLHCSLVGKSIGELFSIKTGYQIRYVNYNPRNKNDAPDKYEAAAIDTFYQDRALTELYSMTKYNGEPVFRYVVPMTIDETCLECHGDPAGELDVLGYKKEGLKIGDLAGALSIIMPIDIYIGSKKENMILEMVFFLGLMLIFVLVTYYATAKLVTKPLDKLMRATEKLKDGNFNTEIDADKMGAQGEIKVLAVHFGDIVDELRNVYTNLENKVELRTQDLAFAKAQLEVINKRLQKENEYKSDFLSIMSHELRTPLTSIVAFAEMMSDQSVSNEEHSRVLNEIIHNSQILLSLINNTLDMAKLEAGNIGLNIEQMDLVDVVNSVETMIEPIAHKKNIALTTTVDDNVPIIDADREKFHRVIENLLSNAVKFTKSGGSVDLSVSYDKEKNEITIIVSDNGIGIGKGYLSIIFEKFLQGDSSSRRPYNGSGLGLALAKEYVEMHGGTISVQSELGVGSVFTVLIPANTSKEYDDDEDFTG